MKLWFHYSLVNRFVIVGSVILCLLLSPTRLPGMEILGIGTNWVLIWVVIWSLKRSVFQGVTAGLVLGLIQDGLTGAYPSHVISLVLVGFLTSRLQKQRYIQEDFISVALIVFLMVIIAETITAAQYLLGGIRTLEEILLNYQQLVLSSAILSSLWAPVLYYPLNNWWQKAPISTPYKDKKR
ncbi:MAG TPA: rod shape-determining protein MreD [Cyanothece sp. UBA12306]|nr:rod shape-determining protein MreD [Cyanothece sp. UBA12306]